MGGTRLKVAIGVFVFVTILSVYATYYFYGPAKPVPQTVAANRFSEAMQYMNIACRSYDATTLKSPNSWVAANSRNQSWRYHVFLHATGEDGVLHMPSEEAQARIDFVQRHANWWALYGKGTLSYKNSRPRIVAVCGPGTAFDGGIYLPERVNLDTIVLVEYAHCKSDWNAFCDFSIKELEEWKALGLPAHAFCTFYEGFHVVFADGECWFLSRTTPWDAIEPLLTIERSQTSSRDRLLRTHCQKRHIADLPGVWLRFARDVGNDAMAP